jgi:hypothetical protein
MKTLIFPVHGEETAHFAKRNGPSQLGHGFTIRTQSYDRAANSVKQFPGK